PPTGTRTGTGPGVGSRNSLAHAPPRSRGRLPPPGLKSTARTSGSLGKRRRRSPPSTVSRRLMGFGEESLESLVLGVISARAARSRRRARDPHASPWSSLFWRRRVKKRGSATPAMLSSARRFSQLVQQRLRRDEIARVESFGEPSIDGRERV